MGDCVNTGGAATVASEAALNELFLWHGCSAEVARQICDDGFDPQRGGEATGKMFGVGAYFAAHASKSDLYCVPDENGVKCMVYARVLLGCSHRALTADTQRHRPPESCHSLWAEAAEFGGCVDFPEYVIYRHFSAVPCYKVFYKHQPNCECALCRR